MRINIKVIPRAKSNSVTCDDGVYIVRTTAVPVDGKANDVVQKMLAKHFDVAKSCVQIVRGAQSRTKIVEIVGK
ncbi:MAG: DUF167 domain-containing protein [Parcubacteria group bacterium]|jgi:hypothetical protein